MKFKNIQIKGIGRLPGNMIENGYCDELINLRHKDGVLRAIGNKQVTAYNNPSGTWSNMWIHQMDTVTNLIGYNSSYELCKIETSGSYSVIKAYTSTQSDLRVVTMKRFLIVLATNIYDVFHWDGANYTLVEMWKYLSGTFTLTDSVITCDSGTTAEAVLGHYFDAINQASTDNKFCGSITLRMAYKLYDGSYILHTIPILSEATAKSEYFLRKSGSNFHIETHAKKISVELLPALFASTNSDIVASVCIFASQMEDTFDISEKTITDTLLGTITAASNTFQSINIPLNADYLNLADSPSWYKIHEVTLSELKNSATYNKEIDIRGFYQDYGTRETLPVDNFSYHSLSGYAHFNYNSRLLIGKTTTMFGSPGNVIIGGRPDGTYTYAGYLPGYFRVIINTDDGEKAVYQAATINYFTKGGSYYIFLSGYTSNLIYSIVNNGWEPRGVIGYPDTRAVRLDILTQVAGNYYFLFGSLTLSKSQYDNYSYYKASEFGTIVLTNTVLTNPAGDELIESSTLTATYTYTDLNRVQASELSNPLVFPAENSYQVGTGSIIAICAASEPLSTGQFGEYPVHIFTTKGIYALNQGSGDVLFSTVTPASPEVANNRDNVISLGSGVVFTTADGIYVIQGRQVKDIGKIMYGKPDTQLKNNAHLHRFLNGGNLPFFPDTKLSDINFQDYLSGSVVGYDKQNNELVISNDDKQYSYVYNFDSGFWFKYDVAYSILINNYPELWGVTVAAKILNISIEYWDYPGTSTPAPVPIMFLTRPIKIDADGIFSLIHRTWLRCFVNTPSYLLTGIYVFGSNDMITWQFLTGMQREGQIHDMRLTRIHSKVKYFSLMFTAAMDRDSHIGNLELQYYNKLTNKIR